MKTRLMKDAPRNGQEILGFHEIGKTLHPIKWCETKKCWIMRWNDEYRQYDFDFIGWVDMPEINSFAHEPLPQMSGRGQRVAR